MFRIFTKEIHFFEPADFFANWLGQPMPAGISIGSIAMRYQVASGFIGLKDEEAMI